MRVDEAGRDDGAAEVDALVRLRLLAVPDRRDEPVLDEHPARRVLGARVVAGDDPAAGEERVSCLERDELEAVDVDEPAVGDLQVRDHREPEERQREERRRAGPAELVGAPRCRRGSAR